MSNIEQEFVPYDESLDLKELGFDEECFKFFDTEKYSYQIHSAASVTGEDYLRLGIVKRPLYSQAFRWFRKKHKLHSSLDFQKLKEHDGDEDIELYEWRINEQWQVGKDWFEYIPYGFKHQSVGFNLKSYEEAELECLKKLIEIVKNKRS
jgi:hypothetical protein